jgi:hypothetical protein
MKTNRSMQIRRDVPGMAEVPHAIPPGFSNAMSRVCGMVWPVWPDTASSEHDADLAGSDRTTMVTGACGTSVSRHPLLQRTPVDPLDQRRAVCVPI